MTRKAEKKNAIIWMAYRRLDDAKWMNGGTNDENKNDEWNYLSKMAWTILYNLLFFFQEILRKYKRKSGSERENGENTKIEKELWKVLPEEK